MQLSLNLSNQINTLHDTLFGMAKTSLQTAIKIGELLAKQKAEMKHGEWLPWCRENLKFGATSAAKYLALHRDKDKISLGENLGVNEAYRLLSQPAEDQETEPAEESDTVVEIAIEPADEPESDPELYLGGEEPKPEAEIYSEEIAADEQPEEPAPLVKLWTTLDEWEAMDAEEKTALLDIRGTKQFNEQTGDSIEWARWSWNPITGCRHGCKYCYARDIAARFYPQGFKPTILPDRLDAPHNTKPRQPQANWTEVDHMGHKNVFVCSMADLFGKWVPKEWIDAVLSRVRANPQWNFLFLTKFPTRMAEFNFPNNAWVGASVDSQGAVTRAEKAFSKISAGVTWLSCEPMMERLTFSSLEMFDWVVIGGSSASVEHKDKPGIDDSPATPEFRPPFEWIAHLYGQAVASKCKVYMKTNLLERVREYPI